MLSDREQRALEDLERCYGMTSAEPRGPDRRSAQRADRPPGFRTVVVLASLSVVLVLAGVPAAGFAVAMATAMCWVLWRLWVHRADEVVLDRAAGATARQYLAWLAGENR